MCVCVLNQAEGCGLSLFLRLALSLRGRTQLPLCCSPSQVSQYEDLLGIGSSRFGLFSARVVPSEGRSVNLKLEMRLNYRPLSKYTTSSCI